MVGAKEESKHPAPVITPLPPAPNSTQTHLLLNRFPDPVLLSKPETKPIEYKPTVQTVQDYNPILFHPSTPSDPHFTSKFKASTVAATQTTVSSKLPTVITSTHYVPSLDNSYPSTTMELHDSSGTLLPSFSVNPDHDQSQQQNVVPNSSTPQMLHPPSSHPNVHIHNTTANTQDIASNGPQDAHNVGDIRNQPIITSTSTANIPPISSHHGKKLEPIPTTLDSANTHAVNEAAVAAANPTMAQSNSGTPPTSASLKKPSRMPGTKQCPSCQSTIAAAVAKCPKCPHVFREKKEKIKRSGKRGKKNCPKCKYENPSACSSCKNCKYVFRLKLMDKYKQLRSRQQQNESDVAAAAAAAHAAANMAHNQHTAVSAVSTVPLPAGVTAYPNHLAPQLHPSQVMPPLTQHHMALHPHAHNVHATSMPQIHPLPQHTMHQNPTHPQL